MIEILLNTNPEQIFNITIDDVKYDMRVIYNSRLQGWSVDISQNGTVLVSGVALLGGVDILDQYNFDLKNMFTVNINDGKTDAKIDTLGIANKLFVLTDDEFLS